MEERAKPQMDIAGNTVALEESLAGEPDCLTMYRCVGGKVEVGAFVVRDLCRDVCFGPLVDEDEEESRQQEGGDRTSSQWMRVRRRALRLLLTVSWVSSEGLLLRFA